MNRTIEIYGKSEFIAAANRQMQSAFFWYARGKDALGDECAKEAEKFFDTARRCNYGAYTKTIVGLVVR